MRLRVSTLTLAHAGKGLGFRGKCCRACRVHELTGLIMGFYRRKVIRMKVLRAQVGDGGL